MARTSDRVNSPMRRDARRRGGALRKVLIALAVVVVLIVALVITAPMLLSGVVASMVQGKINDGIAGKVAVSKVSLSWTGPQQIGSMVLADPSGAKVGEVSARVQAGLLGLAAGSRDLGLIRLRGRLDLQQNKDGELNLTAALAQPGAAKPISVPPGGTHPTTSGGGAPATIKLPKTLAFQVDASDIDVRYTPPGVAASPVGVKTTKAAAVFATGKPVDLEIEAQTLEGEPAFQIDFHADRLTDDKGVLSLHDAKIDLAAESDLSQQYTDAFAKLVAPAPQPNLTVGSAPGGMKLTAKFEVRNGRLSLADPTKPAMITGRIPDALMQYIPVGDAKVTIDAAPQVTVGIQKLDLPMPKDGTLLDADFRDATLEMAMSTDPITGTADGKPFKIDPLQPTLRQLDNLFDQTITWQTAATYADLPAGTIQVDLRAAGLLNQDGRLRIGPFAPKGEGYAVIPGPEYLRGVVRVYQFPTVLIQPLVERYHLDLEKVAGPTLAADLRAGVRQGTDELPKEVLNSQGEKLELPPIGQPYFAATIDSRYTTAWIDTIIDANALVTRNDGIKIQTDKARELFGPFLPPETLAKSGDGKAILELTNINIPLVGGSPNLRAAAGTVRLVFGDLTAQTDPNVSPIYIESLDTGFTLTPNAAPTWGVDWRASLEGAKFAIVGNGDVLGVIPGAGEAGAFFGLDLAGARPTGKLQLLDVPTRVASLASERVAQLAQAAFGTSLKGTVQGAKTGDAGAHIDLSIQGDRGVLQGALDADAHAVTLDDKGVMLTLFDPGLLLDALARGGQQAPPLTFDDAGSATLTLSNTSIPVKDFTPDAPLKGVVASAKLHADGLSGAIRAKDQTSSLALKTLDANLALDAAGDATLVMSSDGSIAGKPTTSSGSIVVRGLRDRSGRIDTAGARLEGSWKAQNVPTSLVALVAPDNQKIVDELVGASVDVALTPLEGAGGRGGWDLTVNGTEFNVTSRVALAKDAVVVGPSTARAVLTPGAVDAALAAYQPDLTPRPKLAAPVPLTLSGDALSVPLSGGSSGSGLTLAADLRAEGDVVLTDLPGIEQGATSSLGLRDLHVNAAPARGASGGSDVTLSSKLFDPPTNKVAATLSASTVLPMSGVSGKLTVSDADTATLDKMLATKGLLQEIAGDRLSINVNAEAPKGAETVPLAATIDSPRLDVSAKLTRDVQGISLVEPASVHWTVTKATAQRLLFPAKDEKTAPVSVENGFTVNWNVGALQTGPGATPFRPGTFKLASELRAGALTLVDPKTNERMIVPATQGRLAADPTDGSITFYLQRDPTVAAPADASASNTDQDLLINATITHYATDEGAPAFANARVTSDVKGNLPTPIVDALASMDGLLTALIGNQMNANIHTINFSEKAGTGEVQAQVTAPYASLDVEGAMKPGANGAIFATTKTGTAKLTRITNEASEQLLGVLFPLLTRFEKTANDEPAVITAEGLTLPTSHDTKELNGVLHIDPGTMEFATKGFFSKILKATHNKQTGSIGRKLQPFDITIEKGVARYQDVVVPTGEFDFLTSGKVNLNKRTMDIYVFVPMFAVEENLASIVKNVPGVGDLSRVPIRVKGDFNSPDVSVDPQEMIRSLPSNLGRGVEDLLKTPGNILDQLFKGGDSDSSSKTDTGSDQKKSDDKKGNKKNGGKGNGKTGGGG